MAEGTAQMSPEQREQLEGGLRILARLIARAYARDRAALQGDGHGHPGGIPSRGSDGGITVCPLHENAEVGERAGGGEPGPGMNTDHNPSIRAACPSPGPLKGEER